MPPRVILLSLLLAAGAACEPASEEASRDETPVRFWHTFQPHESEALNRVLAGRREPGARGTLLPFARGMVLLGQALSGAEDCPDLVRIDATWLAGLARADRLRPAPPEVFSARDWLPEAAALARDGDEIYGLPQSLDGLALLSRGGAPGATPWPPATLDQLLEAAGARATADRHGLDLRVDGYWFLTFLRARGGDGLDPTAGTLGIDEPGAARALAEFAALYSGGAAAPPPPPGEEAREEAKRFRENRIAIAVTGPWAAHALSGGAPETLEVTAFPRGPDGKPAAPRGGNVLVVPQCARAPDEAWALALDLTAPHLQADWARRFGVLPTTRSGLARTGAFANRFYRAIESTAPLPRHPATAEMFDDLTPAVAAAVSGDATPEEALAGVARAWTRLLHRHGITNVTAAATDTATDTDTNTATDTDP